jgi:hypothetical protein
MQGHLAKSSSKPVRTRLQLQQCGVKVNKAQLGNNTKGLSGLPSNNAPSPTHSKQGPPQVKRQQSFYADQCLAGAAFLALVTIAIAVATTQLGADILLLAPWMSSNWTIYGNEGALKLHYKLNSGGA